MSRQKKVVKTINSRLREMMANGVLEQEQVEVLEDIVQRLGHAAVTRNRREQDKILQDLVRVLLKS